MLQEVQGVTPSAAAGIRADFESFKVLMDAYERAERKGGRERAEVLLQDCEVCCNTFSLPMK
jgi:crossover junction endonuclease EME1